MEEAFGKFWHGVVTRAASRECDEARVTLEDMRRPLSLWFHAFGGSAAFAIAPAVREPWRARRRWIERVAGQGWQVALCWRDADTLYLPESVACFPDRELNRQLYRWLAALAALPDEASSSACWIAQQQARVVRALAQWPGLTEAYHQLVRAHLAMRQPAAAAHADDEQHLRLALLDPWRAVESQSLPRDLEPVPLWLHPAPPWQPPRDNGASPDIDASTAAPAVELPEKRARQARRVDEGKKDDGIIVFRLESLFSWAEFINVDRPQEEDEELGAREAANDLDEFALSRQSGSVSQRLKFDLDLPAGEQDDLVMRAGISLPEWDYRRGMMLKDHVTLTLMQARDAGPCPLPVTLKHSARQIRQWFEHMVLNRHWRRQEPQGSELDLDAWIAMRTALQAGQSVTEARVYRELRRQGRDLSCLLLADLSLSTEAAIDENTSVIDVVRDGLFLMSEAMDATGDRCAIAGFSSKRRDGVRYFPIKGFGERLDDRVRGRIRAVRPGLYTRMGAAIRHATRELQQEKTAQRLLLLLTDGKPNDVDRYEGRHGLEDTRRAVQEARCAGIIPFCVTIDTQAGEYLPWLFGQEHHVVIHKATQLPTLLPTLYARLTGLA